MLLTRFSERRVFPFPKKLAQNQGSEPSHCNTARNDVVLARHYTLGDGKYIGHMPRSENQFKVFLIDLPKEGKLPPLKNKLWKWCCESPLQHLATQHYTSAEITL